MVVSLRDDIGRKVRKLRVSLTEVCNLRCFYCMPEKARFKAAKYYLSPVEIQSICQRLKALGIEQVRVTGGEPTARTDFAEVMTGLGQLDFAKLGLTSNGVMLKQHLPMLAELGCWHLNISLDSLQSAKFSQITRRTGFDRVLASIFTAKEMGFTVKINAVLMQGINDDELLDFVAFSAKHGIEVRFLELMKIGQACNKTMAERFMTASQAIDRITMEHQLHRQRVELDSTSFVFTTDSGAKIGFIASESQPFCGHCSRWRLTADGFLRACLMSTDGVAIKGLSESQFAQTIRRLLPMKPTDRIEKINQDMNQIGG